MKNFKLVKLVFITILFTTFLSTGLLSPRIIYAVGAQEAGASAVPVLESDIIDNDIRLSQLEAFLENYHSPLSGYCREFIVSADRYEVDWRLVPAIAGVESSFGKRTLPSSFNAYGWDGGNYYFENWSASIELMNRKMRENYYAKGLDTPQKIGPVYAPPTPSWSNKVGYFMRKISQTVLPPRLEV